MKEDRADRSRALLGALHVGPARTGGDHPPLGPSTAAAAAGGSAPAQKPVGGPGKSEPTGELRSLKCSRCSLVKLSIKFYVNRSRPSGLSIHCKDCHREWDKARAARRRDLRVAAATADVAERMFDGKRCSKCGVCWPLDQYEPRPGANDQRGSDCRLCRNADSRRRWMANEPGKARQRERQVANEGRIASLRAAGRADLADWYVRSRLREQGVPNEAISAALVAQKREELTMQRLRRGISHAVNRSVAATAARKPPGSIRLMVDAAATAVAEQAARLKG